MNPTIRFTSNTHTMRKAICFFSFMISIFGMNLNFAQVVDPSHSIIPPAPTAANLGKYGDIPVNLYTGIPEITIPIYTITGSKLSLPISISYHAGGNKVEEIASWIGLAWSLNAGGVVTRTVYGRPDEKTNGYQQIIGTVPSSPINESTYQSLLYDLATNTKDAQPDEFYFNVNGLSGKFVIDENGLAHTIPYMDVLITPTISSGNITQFSIVASDGTVYVFSAVESTTPETTCGGDGTDDYGQYNSSWFLTSITTPNGEDVITLAYTSYSYSYDLNLSETENFPNAASGVCAGEPLSQTCQTSLSISGKRLNTITSANEIIEFEVAESDRDDLPGDYALSKILIKNASSTLIKAFEFGTSYFSTGTDPKEKRLKLESVTEEDDSENELPATEFTYNTTALPARNSNEQDHWGFYNGATTNTTLLPEMQVNCIALSGANREPNETYMKAGILEKITYPTGGSTEFEYESNRYGYVRNIATDSDDDVGTSASETAIVVETENDNIPLDFDAETFTIDYTQNVTFETTLTIDAPGTGFANYELRDALNNIIDYDPPGCDFITLDPGTYTIKVTASGEMGHPTTASITVHYKTATNVFKNLIGGGLRVKTVTTKDNYSASDIITKYEYKSSDDATRSSGVLGNKPDYYSTSKRQVITDAPCIYTICSNFTRTASSQASLSAANGSPVVYKEVKMILGEEGENGSSISKFTYNQPSGGGFPYAPLKSYDYKNGLLTEKTDYDADDNIVSKVINTYTYEGSNNFSQVRGVKIGFILNASCGADDEFGETEYQYTSEWFYLSEQKNRIYNTDHSGNYLETTTNYFFENPTHIQLTKQVTINSDGNTYTTRKKYPNDYTTTATPTNQMAKSIYYMSNSKHMHNVLIEEYTSLKKSGESDEKVISGKIAEYKVQSSSTVLAFKEYLLETATPLTLTTVFTPSTVTSNVFSSDSRYVLKLTYENYDSELNLIQYSRPDDQSISFLWNYNFQFPVAQIINCDVDHFCYTSFEADNKGNWNYNVAGEVTSDPGSDLYAKTGTKYFNTNSYPVSKTSITPGNYILSYWIKDATPTVFFTGATGVATITGETDPNGWTYKETKFSIASSGGFSITGNCKIDEVRLYPSDAQMKTFAFTPLVGVTEMCDENNVETHYEFDKFSRLEWVEDYNRDPLLNYKYAYKTTTDDDDQNYIKIATALIAGLSKTDMTGFTASHDDVQRNFQFFDGLGRIIQVINRYQSFNSNDIISILKYDEFGREQIKYLPYTEDPNPHSAPFRTDPLTEQADFYDNADFIEHSDYPYSETVFEPSPLNRVTEQSNPGTDWKLTSGHTLTTITRTNTSGEQVLLWKLNGSSQWEATSYYAANSLYVTETKDENGNMVASFKDKAGRNICIYRQKAGTVNTNNPLTTLKTQFSITYFVYDDMGNLAEVIPPAAIYEMINSGTYLLTTTIRQKWITEYTYDKRQRLIEKKIPGADIEYSVYDNLDRIVLQQDGNLRNDNNWEFFKYDILNRPILNGIYNDATHTTRSSMQSYIDANFNSGSFKPYESKTSTSYSSQQGYTNQALPTHDYAKILNVNYYADYDFDVNGTDDYTFYNDYGWGTTAFYRINNKITGIKTRMLNSDGSFSSSWLSNINFYDKKNNLIEIRSIDHLSKTNMTLNSYDFINKISKSKYTPDFTAPGAGTAVIGILKTFSYDNARRLLQIKQKNYTDAEIILCDYKYNEMGQLIEKNLHSTNSGTSYLQSVDFLYNIRGWIKNINNATLDLTGLTSDDNGDLFGLELYYTNPLTTDFDCIAQYNGNITMTRWKTSGDANMHGYGYRYDEMNRITKATYKDYTIVGGEFSYTNANRFSMPSITYDDNGNILTMQQKGYSGSGPTFGDMDDLTYVYKGNQLLGVNDAVADISGGNDFSDFGSESTIDPSTSSTYEYLYDYNGNMRRDKNKNVDITYNILNLPALIYKNSTHKIEYIYSATGAKLQKKVTNGATVTTTDYVDNHVYKNTTLDFFTTEEGRVINNSGTRRYEYYITDQLGNNRVFFADADNNGAPEILQNDDYYPFGLQINRGTISNSNKWLYGDKEYLDDLNIFLSDFGARNYDSQIGRWNQIDPFNELYKFNSPYLFVGGNPISNIDPTGMAFWNSNYLNENQENWTDKVLKETREQEDKNKYDFAGKPSLSYSYNWNTGEYENQKGESVTWDEVSNSLLEMMNPNDPSFEELWERFGPSFKGNFLIDFNSLFANYNSTKTTPEEFSELLMNFILSYDFEGTLRDEGYMGKGSEDYKIILKQVLFTVVSDTPLRSGTYFVKDYDEIVNGGLTREWASDGMVTNPGYISPISGGMFGAIYTEIILDKILYKTLIYVAFEIEYSH